MDTTKSNTLLIELLCEELPPKSLQKLSMHFGTSIFAGLKKAELVSDENAQILFATPRRLAVQIKNVLAQKEDCYIERKGPAVSSAFDDKGDPTKALIGFAKSCGVEVASLTEVTDGKRQVMSAKVLQKGADIDNLIVKVLNSVIKTLPVAKNMRWGYLQESFVRPVHRITILFGARVVSFTKWNINSDRVTAGHRFLGEAQISIPHADEYENLLRQNGKVIASFDERKKNISEQLIKIGDKGSQSYYKSEALLDEVTALTEYPVVLMGEFANEFLQVPQEALMVSMIQHQKYFPVLDDKGKILPKFLIVANMKSSNEKANTIVQGNERVLRARLADAKFFYDTDCKNPLSKRVQALSKVTYLQSLAVDKADNKGASLFERVERVSELAKVISSQINPNLIEGAQKSAKLAKVDLVSALVGEFPELQGIAGYYYAKHEGINDEVAIAIREHYQPRFSGDALPQSEIGQIVALADKFESICGIFGIGKIPTGDKDPFGLRRQALGIIRILLENKLSLDINELFKSLPQVFANTSWKECQGDVYKFILERLRNFLREAGYAPGVIESVVAPMPSNFADTLSKIIAIDEFMKESSASSLIAIGKRIRNIIKKSDEHGEINPQLFTEQSEKALFAHLQKTEQTMKELISNEKFSENLKLAISFEEPLANFFDEVMVMAEDVNVRNNRLALLVRIDKLINGVGNINELVV